MIPTGPDPNVALTEGFFEAAARQPRPTSVALLSADAVFSSNPILGARENAAKYGFDVVHEASYPLTTTDLAPYLDEVAKSGSDVLFLCTYLQDTVDLVRALDSHPFQSKMVGAAMIGPQNSNVKSELGPLLNGIVNYEYWVPAPSLAFEGVAELLETYRSGTGLDALGHYMAPLAYAQMQVVSQAIEGTGSLDDAVLSEFTRHAAFATVMGAASLSGRAASGPIPASCRCSSKANDTRSRRFRRSIWRFPLRDTAGSQGHYRIAYRGGIYASRQRGRHRMSVARPFEELTELLHASYLRPRGLLLSRRDALISASALAASFAFPLGTAVDFIVEGFRRDRLAERFGKSWLKLECEALVNPVFGGGQRRRVACRTG